MVVRVRRVVVRIVLMFKMAIAVSLRCRSSLVDVMRFRVKAAFSPLMSDAVEVHSFSSNTVLPQALTCVVVPAPVSPPTAPATASFPSNRPSTIQRLGNLPDTIPAENDREQTNHK